MKQVIAILLCLCVLLAGCGKQPEQTEPTTLPTAAPTTEPVPTTQPQEEPSTEATTEPATEPIMLYCHPLTGEALEEPCTVRPTAVSINNYRAAQPVYGISYADVIFEHITEGLGTETRMLAIFTDLDFDAKIGTVRSARTYSISMASSMNAILVHCGGSKMANSKISSMKYPTLDQFYNDKYFYRDQGRKADGYASEHTLMTEGNLLQKGLNSKSWNLTVSEDAYYGFDFSDESLNGASAESITIQYYNTSGKYTFMSYNKEDGMYYGLQQWGKKQVPIADANDNTSVGFKNVIVLKSKVTHHEDGSHIYMTLTGEGDGFLARDGQYVPIKWTRATESDPFSFTLEDGTPVTLGVGKTYVSVLPTRSPEVIFE